MDVEVKLSQTLSVGQPRALPGLLDNQGKNPPSCRDAAPIFYYCAFPKIVYKSPPASLKGAGEPSRVPHALSNLSHQLRRAEDGTLTLKSSATWRERACPNTEPCGREE